MLASVKAEAECAMCTDDDDDATVSPFLSSLPKLAYVPLFTSSLLRDLSPTEMTKRPLKGLSLSLSLSPSFSSEIDCHPAENGYLQSNPMTDDELLLRQIWFKVHRTDRTLSLEGEKTGYKIGQTLSLCVPSSLQSTIPTRWRSLRNGFTFWK